MKKFHYRMQNILNIQLKLEEQARSALAEANRLLQVQEELLLQFMEQKKLYENEYTEAMKDYLDFTKIHYYSHAIDVMKTRIRSQMIEVHVAEKNAESARNQLQEIMIVRKSHEALKDRALEEYRNEWNQEEGKEIDQLVSYTHTAAQRE